MRKFAKAFYLVFILFFMYLPIGTLMVLSFNSGKNMNAWQGFSLKWYREIISNQEILGALGNTLTIALWASVIATVVGVLACIGLNSMRKRTQTVLLGFNNVPLLNADIVTGISLMMSFLLFGISLNYGTVLFAHITFCIPYVILSVMPKFRQLENSTYEAALDLGASPLYAFFKVVLPDIMPGVVSGFLLSFTMSVDDFVITHFTRGAGINTLSTLIYSQVKIGVRPTLYALSTVIFVIVLLVLIVFNVASSRARAKSSAVSSGFTGKKIIAFAAIIVLCMCGAVKFSGSGLSEKSAKGTVYVYCFGDYFDPEIEQTFEEQTGYDLVIDYFDTNEEMYPVIKNNTANYDVVCVSDYMIDRLVHEDLLQEIDYDNIPNMKYLYDKVVPFIEDFDPGMKYTVPHTWGTYGILYNPNMVDDPVDSWEILWDEKYAGQIIMPNSVREAFMVADELLGYSINTADEGELQNVVDLLNEQKPLVYSYQNDSARDSMIGGSAAMAVIASGEVLYAQEDNPDLEFALPKEGSEVWTDCWAITKTAANKRGAEEWINFMMDPEIANINYEYLTYAIPNVEIPDVLTEEVLNPDEEVLSRCETLKYLGGDLDDLYSKYWKAFKAK